MQHQQQHEFSYWLHTLRAQQPAPASNASSYADTDSDSDSDRDDAEQHHFAFCTAHSKHHSSSKMALPFARTAPMMIPQTSRRHHRRGRASPAYFENEFEESAPRQSAFGFYSPSSSSPVCSSSSSSADDVDEDDPALYQNLAYFRSQHARQSHSHSHSQQQYGARSRSSSPQPRSSVSSLSNVSSSSDDDDIFDIEL